MNLKRISKPLKILNITFYHTSGPKSSKNNSYAIWPIFFFFETRERNSIILPNLFNFETKPSEDRFTEKWELSIITRNENILSKTWANQVQ